MQVYVQFFNFFGCVILFSPLIFVYLHLVLINSNSKSLKNLDYN